MQGWEWGTALGLRYGDGQGFRTMRQQRIHSTQPMRLQLQPPAQRVLIMCSYDRGFSLTRSHLEGKLQERGGKWGQRASLHPCCWRCSSLLSLLQLSHPICTHAFGPTALSTHRFRAVQEDLPLMAGGMWTHLELVPSGVTGTAVPHPAKLNRALKNWTER